MDDSTKRTLAIGIIAGALLTFTGLLLLARVDQCAGISTRGFVRLDLWNCSDVGPYMRYRGIWVDGYEEGRFFPDATALPSPVPDSENRLLVDEAAKGFIYRTFPRGDDNWDRQIIEIEFWGNELRPYRSTLYKRYYAVRKVGSTRLIRREYRAKERPFPTP